MSSKKQNKDKGGAKSGGDTAATADAALPGALSTIWAFITSPTRMTCQGFLKALPGLLHAILTVVCVGAAYYQRLEKIADGTDTAACNKTATIPATAAAHSSAAGSGFDAGDPSAAHPDGAVHHIHHHYYPPESDADEDGVPPVFAAAAPQEDEKVFSAAGFSGHRARRSRRGRPQCRFDSPLPIDDEEFQDDDDIPGALAIKGNCGRLMTKCPTYPEFTTSVPPTFQVGEHVGFTFAIQKQKATALWSPPQETMGFTLHGLWADFKGTSRPTPMFCCKERRVYDCEFPDGKPVTLESCWPQYTLHTPPRFSVWNAVTPGMRENLTKFHHSFKANSDDCVRNARLEDQFWTHEYRKHGQAITGPNGPSVTAEAFFAYALEVFLRTEDWWPIAKKTRECLEPDSRGHLECVLRVLLPAGA